MYAVARVSFAACLREITTRNTRDANDSTYMLKDLLERNALLAGYNL